MSGKDHYSQERRRAYAAAALDNMVANLVATTKGDRNNTLNKCAFAAGQLIGAGAIEEREVVAALLPAARSIGLDEREARATIASGIEAGKKSPRDLTCTDRPERRNRARAVKAARRVPVSRAETTSANLPDTEKATAAKSARNVQGVLARSVPMAGTPAAAYFRTRGLDVVGRAGLDDLRFVKDLPYYNDQRELVGYYDAVIGLVRDCQSGEVVALHRTHLADGGNGKANVDKPRKMLAPTKGGMVAFGNISNAVDIAVSEGIENALTNCVVMEVPTAALLSTSGFKNFPPSDSARSVTILADDDQGGLKAAQDLANRLCQRGIKVRVVVAPAPHNDINGLLMAKGPEAVREVIAAAEWLQPDGPHETAKKRSKSKASGNEGWLFDSTCVAAVEARNIEWLWQPRIALGKVTLISGNPGQGKSQLTAYLAARTTRGEPFVDGTACPQGSVIVIACEDDVADTVRPRLEAAGADLTKVHFLNAVRHRQENGLSQPHLFNLADGLDGLMAMVNEIGDVKLIVIDPISAYLAGTDSHKNAEVRELLMPLQHLAAEKGIAVVMITHLNKAAGMDAMARSTGSIAFIAAARAAYLVHRDPADDGKRLLLPLKNNLGAEGAGFAFTIEEVVVAGTVRTSRVVMDATPISMTADEALAGSKTGEGAIPSALADAEQWLENALADGPRASKALFDEAEAEKIAGRTLRRAKRSLGVEDYRVGFGDDGRSMWRLPKPLGEG